MHAFSRFGALVGISIFSFITIALLLPSRISTRIQGIGKNVYTDWITGTKDEITIVVFGDSLADDGSLFGESKSEDREQGKGWTQVLCDEMKCTEHLNFASSASTTWTEAPTGAIVNNEYNTNEKNSTLLPDLVSQVGSYLALLPHLRPSKTLFVLSFGFWDIYSFSSLPQETGLKQVESSVDLIFKQLNRLFAAQLEASQARARSLAREESSSDSSTSSSDPMKDFVSQTHSLQIVIPKLLDPSLAPGWRSVRPVPLAPTPIAEEQKNAVFLTNKWNAVLENKVSAWVSEAPVELPTETRGDEPKWAKDVYYFDYAAYVIDSIRERQLLDRQITDANGMGTEDSIYYNCDKPCLGIEAEDRCAVPDKFLWWDEFALGQTANREIGQRVNEFVNGGDGGDVKTGGKSKKDE